MSLLQILTDKVTDPRRTQGLRTTLPQMFSMIIISNLCGQFGGRAIARFSQQHSSTFTEVLALKHRVPSHVIFSDLLNRVNADEVIHAFNTWASEYAPLTQKELVSADGKALGSTFKDGPNKKQRFEAVVSLFGQQSGLVHAIETYENDKESEINVVLFLIKKLEQEGLTLFLDALHTQKKRLKPSSIAETTT